MPGSHVYKRLLLSTLACLAACGRIDYEPQSSPEEEEEEEEEGEGGPVQYFCPGFTFNVSSGIQGVTRDCDESFAFRLEANQATTVRVTVTSELFEPALTITSDLCESGQERSLSETGTSASLRSTIGANESMIGVVTARSGECQRFTLLIDVL